jgi:hypothetical protein
MNTLSKIEALTTEYSKVFDVRLVAGEDLIRSLVQVVEAMIMSIATKNNVSIFYFSCSE